MPVTRQQAGIGASIAIISAVIGVLTALATLYTQVSQIVETSVLTQLRRDFAPVGTVVSSILTPVDFADATGEKEGEPYTARTWILADGRMVTGTKFAVLTNDKPVPNLQGMFLRGIDTKTDRKAGSTEGYATALPVGNKFIGQTNLTGEHDHSGGVAFGGDQYEAGGNDYHAVGTTQTGKAGGHQHTVEINAGGDSETRPNNVAVYYYIKIN